jgi:hypothetical protein
VTLFSDDDIDAMIEATGGVDVTVAGVTVQGLPRRPGVEVFGDGDVPAVEDLAEVVTVRTGALPALAPGVSIDVDGTLFKVLSALPIEDGALTRVVCTTL